MRCSTNSTPSTAESSAGSSTTTTRAPSSSSTISRAGVDSDPRIAISVDMLDTGIDVPEIVNLVFAKPIRSLVKFEQMIGRGTRLCPDLFGEGKNKTHFRIFDHWGNFAFFEKHYKKAEPTVSKSLMQQLFETRIDLAHTALDRSEPAAFNTVIQLVKEDLDRIVRRRHQRAGKMARKTNGFKTGNLAGICPGHRTGAAPADGPADAVGGYPRLCGRLPLRSVDDRPSNRPSKKNRRVRGPEAPGARPPEPPADAPQPGTRKGRCHQASQKRRVLEVGHG